MRRGHSSGMSYLEAISAAPCHTALQSSVNHSNPRSITASDHGFDSHLPLHSKLPGARSGVMAFISGWVQALTFFRQSLLGRHDVQVLCPLLWQPLLQLERQALQQARDERSVAWHVPKGKQKRLLSTTRTIGKLGLT